MYCHWSQSRLKWVVTLYAMVRYLETAEKYLTQRFILTPLIYTQ